MKHLGIYVKKDERNIMSKTKEFLKIIGSLVLLIILTALVGVFLGLAGFDPNTSGSGIIAVLLSQLVFGVCTYLIIKKKDLDIKDRGILKDSWKMIIIGLGTAGFGNILLSQVVMALGEDNALVKNSYDMLNTAFGTTNTFETVIQILVLVIVAPIVEEYLFRGYVFAECKKMFSLPASLILNGLLFGLFHMNLLQGINTFFLAIVLSLIYYHRANIKDNIIVHMTNNAVAVLPAFFPQALTVISAITIISIIFGLYFLVKICREKSA